MNNFHEEIYILVVLSIMPKSPLSLSLNYVTQFGKTHHNAKIKIFELATPG